MSSRRKRDDTRGGSKANLVGYGFGTTPAASRPSPPNLGGELGLPNFKRTHYLILKQRALASVTAVELVPAVRLVPVGHLVLVAPQALLSHSRPSCKP